MSEHQDIGSSVTAAELARIIEDAALFACRDSTLPMINAVRLESTPQQLIAVATDRFTLGASVASYDEASGADFTASLKLGQAQTLAKIAKSCRAAFANVAITHADDKLTFAFNSGESLTLPTVTGPVDFPDWRKLIAPREDEEVPVKVVGYNPAYLARFSRVNGADRIAMKFTAPMRPALISVGTQFFGCIMPVRLGSDDPAWQSPDWASLKAEVTPSKPVAKPRAARKPRKKAAA